MKTLKAIVIGLPLSCLTLNAMAAVTWVDNRYAHTWGPEKISTKSVGDIFSTMAQVCWSLRCMIWDRILIR